MLCKLIPGPSPGWESEGRPVDWPPLFMLWLQPCKRVVPQERWDTQHFMSIPKCEFFSTWDFVLQLQQHGIPLTWEGAAHRELVAFPSDDERLLKLIAWHSGLSVLSALILLWQNDGRCLSQGVTPHLWALHSSSGSSELKPGCDLHWKQFRGAPRGGRGNCGRCPLAEEPGHQPSLVPSQGTAGGSPAVALSRPQAPAIFTGQPTLLTPSLQLAQITRGCIFQSCHVEHSAHTHQI